jgi:hypothetical protein
VIARAGAVEPDDAPATVRLRLERTIVSSANPDAHDLVLSFCREDPLREFAAMETSDCAFASPFLAIVPGTNTHIEEV